MSTLRKRGKYWYYYRYAHNKYFAITLRVFDKSSALALQRELDLKFAREDLGIRRVSVPQTGSFFRDYALWISQTKRNSWGERIRVMLKNFTKFLNKQNKQRLDEITFEVVSAYYAERMMKVSAKTVSEEMRVIKNALEYAKASDQLEGVNIKWEMLIPTKQRVKHFPYFTEAEIEAIFASGLADVPFFQVLYYTGLRSVDVANLKRENLNTEKHCIEIWTQKEGVPALIPVHPKIDWIFEIKSDYVFAQYRERKGCQLARWHLKQFLKSAGLNDKGTLHSFRHSFNQRLFEYGLGLEDRQKLLAHSSSKSTGDYTHQNIEVARRAIEQIK